MNHTEAEPTPSAAQNDRPRPDQRPPELANRIMENWTESARFCGTLLRCFVRKEYR
jgi:hypothetical protein